MGCIVVFLAWLGYRATDEWRGSAVLAAERRADEVSALLIFALTKDMQGAQKDILSTFEADELILQPPHEIADGIAYAFSRFPCPESFFVWNAGTAGKPAAVLFNRTGRLPPWTTGAAANGYPVTIVQNSPIADRLISMVRTSVPRRGPFVFFHITIEGIPYQVVARPYYRGLLAKDPIAVAGFTVNLNWVKTNYFAELIGQIERIAGSAGTRTISASIIDDEGRVVAENRPSSGAGPLRERQFAFAFFDSSAVSLNTLRHLPLRQWTARVNTAGDSLLAAATLSANRTRVLILIASVVSILGILLAMRSLHSHFKLESMKADFVAMASHELKTPLASIRLVGDTLAQSRYSSGHEITGYGVVLSKEASRLTRLVGNLLTFSRIAECQNAYSMMETDVGGLVTEALERLKPQLSEKWFDVRVEGFDGAPKVRCDREAVIQVFENIIDNAVKYSAGRRRIRIRAAEEHGYLTLTFNDSGQGIPIEEAPRVFERFYKGKRNVSGSGLGLSIAQRIVEDHGGHISIASAPGEGTTVRVTLPAAVEVMA